MNHSANQLNLVRSGRFFVICICTLLACSRLAAQGHLDSLFGKLDPQKWVAAIGKKADRLQEKIIHKTTATLNRLERQEEKALKKMLSSKDSVAARQQLATLHSKYEAMRQGLKNPVATAGGNYIPKLDSLQTALKFLDGSAVSEQAKAALAKANLLQGQFNQAEVVRGFITERRQWLKERLMNLGMLKQLKSINKSVYYYSAQLNEYKSMLHDSKKMERKALELLAKTKLFKDFMAKHSQLAGMFRLPGADGTPLTMASLAGLQTRAQVNAMIQQQVAAGGPGAAQQVRQNLQQAQAQLTALKDKVLKGGGSSSSDELPDFKPNGQKTKSFWKRMELGTNIQSQKATAFFPVTSDIGLSAGYKLNDKSIIGIGASMKMGWGRGWRDITVTAEGVGVRSFIDYKIKGGWWLSGGYELNYRSRINHVAQLEDFSAWQRSGLLGVSKVVNVKSKFFKKTKLQLLWDLLSYDQVPRTQPIVFRVGYNF